MAFFPPVTGLYCSVPLLGSTFLGKSVVTPKFSLYNGILLILQLFKECYQIWYNEVPKYLINLAENTKTLSSYLVSLGMSVLVFFLSIATLILRLVQGVSLLVVHRGVMVCLRLKQRWIQ
jgi:hypothetical protein